jgi:hypothetical protein
MLNVIGSHMDKIHIKDSLLEICGFYSTDFFDFFELGIPAAKGSFNILCFELF